MTGQISYALLDPTGNITILVETPVPPASQPLVAARLMEAEPSAEQVGFLSPDPACDLALRMAGGEFCGNAAMSAAALCALDRALYTGSLSVRVSGAADPVSVAVERVSDDSYRCQVSMPRPAAVERVDLSPGGDTLPVVRFDGITHVILERAPQQEADEALARTWCRQLGAEALGMIFLDREAGTLTPLVWVPAAGTLFWETSCASGTTAAAAFLARGTGAPLTVSLRQPGGSLEARVTTAGDILLRGAVVLRKRSSLEIQ